MPSLNSPDSQTHSLSLRVVDRIIRRYLSLSSGSHRGGVEWQEIGGTLRKDKPEWELWCCTVALKLGRCPMLTVDPGRKGSRAMPVVEQVYLAEGNAQFLRNQLSEISRLISRGPEAFGFLTPELQTKKKQLKKVEATIERLRAVKDVRGNLFDVGMDYLARQFWRCAYGDMESGITPDPSFLGFLRGEV